MEQKNEMMITFDSRSSNESFARVAVAAFTTQLNPTLEEVADIKTAVSEAITNAIIHGYDNQVKKIRIRCRVSDRTLYVEVEDDGKGKESQKESLHAGVSHEIVPTPPSDRHTWHIRPEMQTEAPLPQVKKVRI